MDKRTGWVALAGQIWGSPENWHMSWNWDHVYHPSKERAAEAGFELAGSDDFNVGHVVKGELVWFGWMDEKFPEDEEDYRLIADYFGWEAPSADPTLEVETK